MRRVAVVVQRYGEGLLGGAEAYARMLVRVLREHHEVTVLTSCARDPMTWAMDYAPGPDLVEGVRLLRFAHGQRNEGGRARVPLVHKLRFLARSAIARSGAAAVARPGGDDRLDGHEYLRRQGPHCPDLVAHLRDSGDRYDVVVFFTALFAPTAHGLPARGRRSVLIPTLHDEKPMFLPWFHVVFRQAGLVLYSATGEATLARRLYGDGLSPGRVVGAPVEVQPCSAQQIDAVRDSHRLAGRWLTYVGRIEKGKGCADLVSAWLALSAAERGDAVLVLVGQGAYRPPQHPAVRMAGFVDAGARDALIAGACATVIPSRHESLSLSLLESLALGVPVVVNGGCDVLAEHVAASGAGESYRSRRGLRAALARALARDAAERGRMGEAGRRYVAQRYGRAVVERGWLDAVETVATGGV